MSVIFSLLEVAPSTLTWDPSIAIVFSVCPLSNAKNYKNQINTLIFLKQNYTFINYKTINVIKLLSINVKYSISLNAFTAQFKSVAEYFTRKQTNEKYY